MKPTLAMFALFACQFTAFALAQGGSGTALEAVRIQFDKEEVLPGEVLEVTLSGFRDATGQPPASSHRVVAEVFDGEILDGEPIEAVIPQGPDPAKAFFVGDGKLKIRYRAPIPCPERKGEANVDRVVIYDSLTVGSSAEVPLSRTTQDAVIGSKDIQLLCPSHALIGYSDYFEQRVPNYSTSSNDIRLTLRVDFASFAGRTPDVLQVTGVEVIRFEGSSRYVTRESREEKRLVGARPSSYNQLAQLQYDKPTGRILAIALPVIPIRLDWAGEAGFIPPDLIDVGPVTQQNEEQAEKELEEEADKLEAMLESGKLDMGQMYKTLSGYMGAVIHPDNKVTQGDGKTYCAGGGKLTEQIEDGVIRKSYQWELFLDD